MTGAPLLVWETGVSLLLLITFLGYPSQGSPPNTEQCIECHGQRDLLSRGGESRFIDSARFARSAHARHGIGCVSCHDMITSISRKAKIPHRIGIEPKCGECHERTMQEYVKSLHAQVSKKICYSCHNPHYSVPFREMSGDERKGICLKCHDATRTHRWLPQMDLHFSHLECTSCHALNARIGMVFFMVDKSAPASESILSYDRLERFIAAGKNDLAETMDQDGDGRLSAAELHSFMKRVQEKGIPDAALEVRILVLGPTHDFSSRGEQTRNCTLCHSRDAKFYSLVLLDIPDKGGGFRSFPLEREFLVQRGQRPFMGDFYLLGESKIHRKDLEDVVTAVKKIGLKWIDLVGVFIILCAVAGVFFHSLIMFLTRKLRQRLGYVGEREPLPVLARIWHWVHGLCVILLMLSGIQLRLPDLVPVFASFLNAVNLHNLSGVVLIIDYGLWLSHHLFKRDFKSRFFISPAGFFKDTAEMLHYYGYLIFLGGSYPSSCREYTTFDPLERVFFLTTMLIFVPIQILSGILLYDVYTTLPVIAALGGLRVVDATHLLCGYLLIASMIIHVYFHTLKKYRGVEV